jgi:hypothetical protein
MTAGPGPGSVTVEAAVESLYSTWVHSPYMKQGGLGWFHSPSPGTYWSSRNVYQVTCPAQRSTAKQSGKVMVDCWELTDGNGTSLPE